MLIQFIHASFQSENCAMRVTLTFIVLLFLCSNQLPPEAGTYLQAVEGELLLSWILLGLIRALNATVAQLQKVVLSSSS